MFKLILQGNNLLDLPNSMEGFDQLEAAIEFLRLVSLDWRSFAHRLDPIEPHSAFGGGNGNRVGIFEHTC